MSILGIILIILGWLFTGFASFVVGCVIDLRGREYNSHYLEGMGAVFIVFVMFGYAAPILTLITLVDWIEFRYTLTKLLYRMANGKKSDEEN